MLRDDKFFRAQCALIVAQHEDTIKAILDDEMQKMSRDSALGETEFAIVKDAIYSAGLKEGMKRVLAKLHEYARAREAN
jgi:flagellar motor component MotA